MPQRPPGRPPVLHEKEQEVREAVRAILEAGGYAQGEGRVMEVLDEGTSLRLVRRVLRELKAEQVLKRRRALQAVRISRRVEARDAVWAVDATHLGRDRGNRSVQGEVLRELASGRTLAVSVGRAASAEEVVRQLEDTSAERDAPPLVLQSDNGSVYQSGLVQAWCRARQVLQLFNLPRTPQHNAAAELGIGEIKREAWLPEAPFKVGDVLTPSVLVLDAVQRIDQWRPRTTLNGVTAVAADSNMPSWRVHVTRERFYATACCAIRRAVLDSPNGRARRRAERNAILHTLERFQLTKTTRGGKPWTPSIAEGFL